VHLELEVAAIVPPKRKNLFGHALVVVGCVSGFEMSMKRCERGPCHFGGPGIANDSRQHGHGLVEEGLQNKTDFVLFLVQTQIWSMTLTLTNCMNVPYFFCLGSEKAIVHDQPPCVVFAT
jgi:hypothetical protein